MECHAFGTIVGLLSKIGQRWGETPSSPDLIMIFKMNGEVLFSVVSLSCFTKPQGSMASRPTFIPKSKKLQIVSNLERVV
jgi:hypothetical protein